MLANHREVLPGVLLPQPLESGEGPVEPGGAAADAEAEGLAPGPRRDPQLTPLGADGAPWARQELRAEDPLLPEERAEFGGLGGGEEGHLAEPREGRIAGLLTDVERHPLGVRGQGATGEDVARPGAEVLERDDDPLLCLGRDVDHRARGAEARLAVAPPARPGGPVAAVADACDPAQPPQGRVTDDLEPVEEREPGGDPDQHRRDRGVQPTGRLALRASEADAREGDRAGGLDDRKRAPQPAHQRARVLRPEDRAGLPVLAFRERDEEHRLTPEDLTALHRTPEQLEVDLLGLTAAQGPNGNGRHPGAAVAHAIDQEPVDLRSLEARQQLGGCPPHVRPLVRERRPEEVRVLALKLRP